jgi:hypothetical protein
LFRKTEIAAFGSSCCAALPSLLFLGDASKQYLYWWSKWIRKKGKQNRKKFKATTVTTTTTGTEMTWILIQTSTAKLNTRNAILGDQKSEGDEKKKKKRKK